MIRKIISGGQTGADRAALDFAIGRGIPHGGWVPRGRRADDGPLSGHYLVTEMATPGYPERTERNVLDSDGTVIITHGAPRGGSALTIGFAKAHARPWLHLDLQKMEVVRAADRLRSWLVENHISVRNVAGPRTSEDARIYETTGEVLEETLGRGTKEPRSSGRGQSNRIR